MPRKNLIIVNVVVADLRVRSLKLFNYVYILKFPNNSGILVYIQAIFKLWQLKSAIIPQSNSTSY